MNRRITIISYAVAFFALGASIGYVVGAADTGLDPKVWKRAHHGPIAGIAERREDGYWRLAPGSAIVVLESGAVLRYGMKSEEWSRIDGGG